MNRRLIFLLLIFAGLTGHSQVKRDLQYCTSLCETIPFNNVKFWSSGMSINKADYWYSLNASPILNVFDVIREDIYPLVILKDLKLKPDTNFLRIYYREGNSYRQFNDTLYFIHPKLVVNEIKQNNVKKYLTDGYYLIQKDMEVSVDFEASFPTLYKKPVFKCNSNEAEKITGIDYKFNSDPWKPAPAPKGIFKISSFLPGLNQLVFQYKTGVSSNYPKDTIYFFRTWFELDPLFSSAGEIWKKDTIVRLIGFPSGGWFTGNGMEGNSVYFNPAKAGIGKHLLTYHFPFRGKDLTTSDTVRVLAYDFTLSGPQSVCANSADVKYSIDLVNQDYDYSWAITGGVSVSIVGATNTVKWDNKQATFGVVKVEATHKISKAKVVKTLKVYKSYNIAYEKPSLFFGDKDNRLVISSIDSAFQYRWIPDGKVPVITKTNFYYFGESIKSNISLTLISQSGCETNQVLTLPNKSTSKLAGVSITDGSNLEKSPVIFPNPANDRINITVDESIGEMIRYSVFNSMSELVVNRRVEPGSLSGMVSVDVSSFPSGLYYLVLKGKLGNVSGKFVVVK